MLSKRIRQLIVAVTLLLLPSLAGAETRVLLVGDSWAGGMWDSRTLRQVFAENGRPDITEEGRETALGGTTARQWREDGLGLITEELQRLPTIDTVQLTISGNDLLAGQQGGGWFVGMGTSQENVLLSRVTADVMAIVDHVLAHSPEMEVIISLYDYLNFVDTVPNGACLGEFQNLGSPTPRQINEALHRLNDRVSAAAASRPRAFFVDHSGTMQFTYGFPDQGIPPGSLTPPGDLDRPSPVASLANPFDCIHLSAAGYAAIVRNLWRGYYDARFNGGGGGGGGGGGTATVRFASTSLQVGEGQNSAALAVELVEAPTGPVMVDYVTAPGTASNDDFQSSSGTLSWDVGDARSQTIDIRVFQDSVQEGNEFFSVELQNPAGDVTIDGSRARAEVLILDDDGPGFCVAAEDVLCLQNNRFRVEVDWQIPDGAIGRGTVQPLSESSGLFWFFSADNFEMILKVLRS